MKRIAIAVGLGVALAAGSADAQLVNFPNYAVPTGAPSTFVAASYGRGLNDNSGKQNAFGVFAGRSGIGDRLSIAVGTGRISYPGDSKFTFGGTVGVAVTDAAASTQISVQGGIGYLSTATDYSLMNFPIGVAVRANVESDSGVLSVWGMPRLNVARSSTPIGSSTSSDFGASAGVTFTTAGGIGFHAALDLLAADSNVMGAGAGIHYVIN